MKITRGCVQLTAFLTSLFCATILADGQPPQAFTLQQILSAPFPTDLVSARAKARFAWVFNAQGRRNVWLAETDQSGTYTSHQVTNYADDDGQDIGELSFSPDSESIVYTRGGDLEFPEKPYPNPSRTIDGLEQDVWMVSSKGGEPRKLGEGHSAAISPKNDAVAYISKGQIWLAQVEGDGKPKQLVHSRGQSSALRWSPDGTALAFVSSRGDHSFIGIYSFATKTLTYPDPSTDKDAEPAWSANGHMLAFLRIPSSKDDLLFRPKRTGAPWSIRVIDLGTGSSREVWKASEGPGSVFREVTAQNQLLWTADDKLAFPWEKAGWTHLYVVASAGGSPKLLTPGEFEVEDVSMTPDLRSLIYSSNQNDIDRRHLWEVSASGGQPSALTSGTGIETAGVSSSDGKTIAMLRSDARLPLRPAIIRNNEAIHDVSGEALPSDFPTQKLVVPQPVILPSTDGIPIHAQLFLPAKGASRNPAIIFFHGGSRRQMLLGWHYMDYYSNAYAMNQYLATLGYVVLSVNYRSGIGYGLNFREALNYGAAGASEFNDVEGAGLYLRSRNDIDPARIGLWGGSYGGYLTALGLARASGMFAAGVDMHGVHDWSEELKNWSESYDPAHNSELARLAWESSPLASVNTWRSPVLLVHGDDDRNVPFSQTVALAEGLRKQGVPFEELIFPDEIHSFLLYHSWLAAYTRTAEFFDRYLKTEPQRNATH